MAKLSHIDDFEENAGAARGEAGAAGGEAARAREKAPENTEAQAAGRAAGRAAAQAAAAHTRKRQEKGAPVLNTAADERDYHGLDEGGMSGGQKLIAVVSFAVLVAVVLYILNYWLHFV